MRRRVIVLCALAYLTISASGDHYWDEYFYLYSVRHHSVSDLVAFEADLAGGLFPDGFFSGKLAFVWALDAIVRLSGDGAPALAAIQLLFAGLSCLVALSIYAALRRIVDEPVAARASIVALFLPLTVYFGWKPLSEMPSLLFVMLAGAQWLRAISGDDVAPSTRHHAGAIACICLAIATLCRVTAPVGFVGFAAAAFLSRRFQLRRLIWTGAALVAAHLVIVLLVLGIFGRPVERILHLVQSVTGRSVGPGVAVYAVLMTCQAFVPVVVLALWRPVTRAVQGAILWAALTMVPFLVSSTYVEPRYFVLALPALALLVERGLSRLVNADAGPRWAATLAAIVLFNRLVFAPLMPFEIAERQYGTLVRQLEQRSPGAAILTSWVTDYCYLVFAFPDARVVFGMSESYAGSTAFASPSFRRWVGAGRHVPDLPSLRALPEPRYYVGWTYNPSVLRLSAMIRRVDVTGRLPVPDTDMLLDHRTPSWIWRNDALRKEPVAQVGDYRAYTLIDQAASAARAVTVR